VDCTNPFHQFGLLVALASAWSLTWYQSPGSQVRVLVFAIYCKIAVAPPLCPRVDFLFSRHTWVGVLKCISELPSSFHQFGLLVQVASAWTLTSWTPIWRCHITGISLQCFCLDILFLWSSFFTMDSSVWFHPGAHWLVHLYGKWLQGTFGSQCDMHLDGTVGPQLFHTLCNNCQEFIYLTFKV
jgi:hypothetical protein